MIFTLKIDADAWLHTNMQSGYQEADVYDDDKEPSSHWFREPLYTASSVLRAFTPVGHQFRRYDTETGAWGEWQHAAPDIVALPPSEQLELRVVYSHADT